MNINEEVTKKAAEVHLLKLKVEEVKLQQTLESPGLVQECKQLRRRIRRFEIDTDEDKALLKSMRIEINRLNQVKDETSTSIDEDDCVKQRSLLEAELSHLEKSNQEFHVTVVKLHTEIYGKYNLIKQLETTLGNLSAVLDKLTKISSILDEHDKAIEEEQMPKVLPEAVVSALSDMEDKMNAGLPDGESVKIMAHQVTPKQMSEMLKITKED